MTTGARPHWIGVRPAFRVGLSVCLWIAGSLVGPLVPLAAAQTPAGTEIVNVARSTFLPSSSVTPGTPPALIEVVSNSVMTPVTGNACFAMLELDVAPTGTVAPGDPLTYEIRVLNGNGAPLSGVVVELPLDPALAPPSSFTDGSAPGMTGGEVACSGSYDPLTHRITWTIPLLLADAGASLELVTAVREPLSETVIAAQGSVVSEFCPASEASNVVVSAVVPPLLQLSKAADRSVAFPGDSVLFTLVATHAGSQSNLAQATLVDRLPPAMRYAAGSARVDDVAVADPSIDADGRTLRLPLGPLDSGASRRVTLVAVVGATARRGEAINVAHVEAETAAGNPLESNRATAAVVIDPGPFRREAHLAGRVFVDDDGDGVSDEDEPGVPGALVLLEDGRGALTDITGRWHIEGVRPGLHVVRLDPSTIDESLIPRAAHAEWAGDSGTRFVNARPSTLVLTDLPVGPPGAPRCRVRAGELQLVLPWASLFDTEGALGDAGAAHLEAAGRWLADLGVAGASMEVDCDAAPSASTAAAARSAIVEHLASVVNGDESVPGDEASQGAPDFERMLRLARPATRILAPANGTRATRDRIDVDVLYAFGTEPRLSVNGVTVPASRIGLTSRLESRAVAASRFVGVALAPGANRIELRTAEDSTDFASIEVWLPGSAVDLRLDVPAGHWITGGREPALLRVEAIDGAGMRSSSRDVVTLEFEGATPLSVDADPHADGHQARLRDGTIDIRFAPPPAPGRVRVRAFSATLEKELFIDVRPGAAAWTVVGLAEARVAGEAGVEGDGGAGPGLEDEFSADGGRIAVFARGPVGEEGSLTVSLDTERERDRDRLERDFEPDLYYPVPGDSGVATDEAAVQGKLFARYDSPAGYAQWGDFATGLERTELMRYDRRLTGASGRFSDGRLSLQGFAASTDQTVVRDVFNADGTSGPFVLSSSPVVARSETVILETRDRFRSEQVLLRHVARRDVDYDLDPLGGTLLFRGPVQPFDIRLNPVRILVIYEARGAGRDQVAAGGRISLAVSDRVEIGASAVVEEREGSNLSLFGVDLAWRPSPGRSVELELASSDEGIAETAVRLDVASRVRSTFGWELSYRDVPAGFANPTLLSAPESGSRRYGGNVVWQPDGPWRVRGEAFVQEDEALDLERRVAGVDAERKAGPAVVSAGVKSVAANGPATGDVSSMLVSAGVRTSIGRRWSGELLREHAFGDEAVPGYPTRTTAGIGYRLREGTRLFLRQEIESGRGSRQDRTVAGVESRVSDNTTARIDYRLEGAADARALRALTGVETRLEAGRHGAMLFSAARLETTRGDEALDYTTLAAGYERRRGAYLFSGRYELRLGQSDDRHLLTVSGAFHPRDPWTLFVRERLFITDPELAERSWRGEGLFGAAYRPRDGMWRFLVRVDHTLSDGGAFTTVGGIAPGAVSGEPGGSVATSPSVSVPAGGGTAYNRTVPGHDDWALSLAAGARMTSRQRLAATVVMRRVAADDALGRPSTATGLISLHYTTEVHRRWTTGASLRRFFERESETATWGHGIELGYLAMRNLWLVAGYNFAGFDDGRYEQTESSRSGPFLSLRFKFDERSLARLGDLRLDRE